MQTPSHSYFLEGKGIILILLFRVHMIVADVIMYVKLHTLKIGWILVQRIFQIC